MDLATGELSVVDREPSYRDGARDAAMMADPAEKALIYLEFLKEAHDASEGTKRKMRRMLGI